MAVLVEAISIVIKLESIETKYAGGWPGLKKNCPNKTLCADECIARMGFMTPDDVEDAVKSLQSQDLIYQDHEGRAVDLIVIDQLRGPTIPCDWIEFGHITLNSANAIKVAAARMAGQVDTALITPEDWSFETSLSRNYGFVPTEHRDKSLRYLRHEDGLDIYFNELLCKEVYVGRTKGGSDD